MWQKNLLTKFNVVWFDRDRPLIYPIAPFKNDLIEAIIKAEAGS